jgi:hypothetical protein
MPSLRCTVRACNAATRVGQAQVGSPGPALPAHRRGAEAVRGRDVSGQDRLPTAPSAEPARRPRPGSADHCPASSLLRRRRGDQWPGAGRGSPTRPQWWGGLRSPVGWTVANQAFTAAPGGEAKLVEVRHAWEDLYLEASRGDDFVGVQSYSSQQVGADGVLPHPEHPDNTLVGTAYRPDALGMAVRHTAEVTGGVPILVTENGIATADDDRGSPTPRPRCAGCSAPSPRAWTCGVTCTGARWTTTNGATGSRRSADRGRPEHLRPAPQTQLGLARTGRRRKRHRHARRDLRIGAAAGSRTRSPPTHRTGPAPRRSRAPTVAFNDEEAR